MCMWRPRVRGWLSGRLRGGARHASQQTWSRDFLRQTGQFGQNRSTTAQLLRHVEAEQQWTESFVRDHNIQAVFSDNCYGCAHPEVHSVLMSHQLQLPVPSPMKRSARKVVSHWASAFQEVWVPDVAPGDLSLSGALADTDIHPATHTWGLEPAHQAPPGQADQNLVQAGHGQWGGAPQRWKKRSRPGWPTPKSPCLLVAGKRACPPTQEDTSRCGTTRKTTPWRAPAASRGGPLPERLQLAA